jgi:putative phosphoesterase
MSYIAIVSDSHDHIVNLRSVITYCNGLAVHELIHCGDLVSPFMLDELEKFDGTTHLIYGNNPGDQHLISTRCAKPGSRIMLYGIRGEITIDGLTICVVHYPEVARLVAESGQFDIVCFGHNHKFEVTNVQSTLMLNPGDLLGKEGPGSFMLLDSESRVVKKFTVGLPIEEQKADIMEA